MQSSRIGAAPAETFCDPAGRIRPGWRTALAATVGLALSPSVLQVMSLGVFTPYLRDEFGWGLRQISFAATILAIMTMIVSPLQGLLVDRFGARRLILLSLPLFGFGYAALSLVSGNIGQFYFGWGLLPLLGIGLWPASYVKATSGWFDRRLGLAIAVATLGVGIGAALLPMLIDFIARTNGWRTAFASIGLASVVIALPTVALFVRDCPTPARLSPSRESEIGDQRRATFWILFGAFLLLGIYSTAILVHLVTILIGNGMDRQAAVAGQAVLGLTMVAGRLGSGFLVDRMPVRTVILGFVAAAMIALGLLAGGVTGGIALVAAALIGLLIGAEIDILGFVVKRYFGSARYGTLYGVFFAVFQLGGAAGVFALGALRETTGSYALPLGLLMLACAGVGGLFALLGPYRYGLAADLLAPALPLPVAA